MNEQTTAVTMEAPPCDGESAKTLGRMTDLGLAELWQVALVLPVSFEDFRGGQSDAVGFDEGRNVIVIGEVRTHAKTTFGAKAPLTRVPVSLEDGTVVTLKWFGDAREIVRPLIPGSSIAVKGTLGQFNGRWEIESPTVVEKRWLGRCQPKYSGIGKRMSSSAMRDRIIELLRTELDDAAGHCSVLLNGVATTEEVMAAIGAPRGVESFARLLVRAHCPVDPSTGATSIDAMEKFAALVTIKTLMESKEREATRRIALPLDLQKRLSEWTVTPSSSQVAAVSKMQAVFSQGKVAAMLLSGDVGTGKTYVYLTLAAGVVDAGGRVAILLPNESLAAQVQADLTKTYPAMASVLVTRDTTATGAETSIAIGTTALLNREAGEFDLLICDEQQKLGAEQRRRLRTGRSHLLEVTATAIPRTMALANFGMIETAHLRQGHARKAIRTCLWERRQMRELFEGLRATIESGARILVVYPAIAKAKGAKALRSIEHSIGKWEEAFPGKVRVINGRMPTDEKAANLEAMRKGDAQIGICTSAIEVGINIPDMRRVVVVHPERFGLTTLHQFRGRLAREGGDGDFDMLLMSEASEETATRLRLMVDITDGYELAEADMRLRGPGELKSTGKRQSGGSLSILYGRELNADHLVAMEPVMKGWIARCQHQVSGDLLQ